MSGLKADSPRSGQAPRAQLVSTLLVLGVTLALLFSGAFEPLEQRLVTLRAQLLDRSPTGEVAIVEIDAKSLKAISTWPWSRRYHALALERLHSAGADIVAFDVDFSSLSDAAGDAAFARALERAQPAILPIFQQRASDDPSQADLIGSRPAPQFGATWLGGVNIFTGADGVVRDYPAATMIGGRIQPSMAALLADNDQFGDRAFQPDWAIDARRIPRMSFADLIEGRVPRQSIAGKRIIIGATAIELGDRYIVPRFGTVPGVVVQALAADSLLQGRGITRSGTAATLFATALVALLLGALPFRRFRRSFAPAALAVMSVVAMVPVAVEALWPISIDSVPMLFCALACIAVRVLLHVRAQVQLSRLVDADTGLGNEAAFEAALAAADGEQTVLAAAAIERFESIRDAVGTAALAGLVRDSAARIASSVGGPVYRIAPDTLAWIEPERGSDVGELFLEPVRTPEGPVDVTVTVGMDRASADTDVRSRIERVLAAISTARATGKPCHWYNGTDPSLRRELSLMGELRRAMAKGELSVFYQPQIGLATGSISHAEALVRWDHPTEGIIPPDRFIPLAESTGVIREVTAFVLARAAADSAWLEAQGRPLHIAVNVSALDIASAEFADRVVERIEANGARPSNFTFEVTESAIIGSPETATAVLGELRERGIGLAIDDYGTGQSSLSYLKQLPVTELKIDKSFVTAICSDENDRIMVRSTIDLAHELGLRVVAEGIEDAATLGLLQAMGCDFAQGYFIGKPMPLDQLCEMAGDAAGERKVA